MNISQIKKLVEQGESNSLEFKTSTSQLKPAFETLCAFLNSKGGVVLIGVKNNGQILGQDVTDNTRQEIAREIKKVEPPAQEQIEIHFVPVTANKVVIVFESHAGSHAPYTYDGRAFSRVQSSTTMMQQHLYEQLLVRRGQLDHAWEAQSAEGYDMNALDNEEIRRTIKEGIDHNRIGVEVLSYDIEHILTNLKLIRDDKLINAGVVLYAKDVQTRYPNCMMRMARFRGTDKLDDFIDNQRVYGNAFRLIHSALEFTQRHLPIASYFVPGKMQRVDQPAVPSLALREALINAVSHRDYSNRSASVALAIYDDRLEIWNNGVLPPELRIEDLRKPHQSYPRNEEIATIFYKRGWVEGWGTGTVRMIGYCQKNGTPEPEFQEYSGGFSVVFRFKEPMRSSREKDTPFEKNKLSIRQNKILELLSTGRELSANDIYDQLDEVVSLRTVKSDLSVLKKANLVEQVGSGKLSLWKLKG